MLVKVKIHPKARAERVEKKGEDSLELWVREPAERGRANKAAASLLAEFFGVNDAAVRLLRGGRRPNKIFEIKK